MMIMDKALKRLSELNVLITSPGTIDEKERKLIRDLANKELLVLVKDLAYKSRDIKDIENVDLIISKYRQIHNYPDPNNNSISMLHN